MKNKLFRKGIATLLAVVMTVPFVLTGCGKKAGYVEGEEIGKVPEETYQIDWYTLASAQKDVETVEGAINEYLKDKLNVTVKLHMLDSAQYGKKMSTMIAAGEKFDLAFSGSGIIDYADAVRSGAFYDMSGYVDTYLPEIKNLFPEDFFNSAYVDGKLGGIPVYKELCAEWGWIYRTDIAEKYNIDMTKIKTLEDLEPYLIEIQKNEPDMKHPIEWDLSMPPWWILTMREVAHDLVIYLDDGVPREKIEILPESEEFQKLSETTRRFYELGLVKPDALTARDANTRFKNGQAFCTMQSLKPDAYKEKYADIKFPINQQPYSANMMSVPNGSIIAVSRTSENPIRVMRFLNMLYTDPVLANLVVFGVEGKHYNLNAEGRVEQIKGSGYDMYINQWMLGNVFLNKLTVNDAADKHEKLLAYNETAVANVANSFWPDLSSVELENIQVGNVKNEFKMQMSFGVLDPQEVWEQYQKKLKDAGIDKVLEVVQAQYEEFLKEHAK